LAVQGNEVEGGWCAERDLGGNKTSEFLLLQIDEKVDARDLSMGAWFEAQVVKITSESPGIDNPCSSTTQLEDVIYYHVRYDE
jgi:hypothetical protein